MSLYKEWKEDDTISKIKQKLDGEILEHLSKYVGMTKGEIISFLDRKSDLTFSKVDKICKFLKVSII